ncbi:hypothetical protein KJ966_01255 [bacterium]|nr:hypothetical protein [bacterium]
MKGYVFHYLKTNRGVKTPDYLLNYEGGEVVVEIGGKGKGRSQFKGIKMDKKLILSGRTDSRPYSKPLSLFGFI